MKRFTKPLFKISKSYLCCPDCDSQNDISLEDVYDEDANQYVFTDYWCDNCNLVGDETTFTMYELVSVPKRVRCVTKTNLQYL